MEQLINQHIRNKFLIFMAFCVKYQSLQLTAKKQKNKTEENERKLKKCASWV